MEAGILSCLERVEVDWLGGELPVTQRTGPLPALVGRDGLFVSRRQRRRGDAAGRAEATRHLRVVPRPASRIPRHETRPRGSSSERA